MFGVFWCVCIGGNAENRMYDRRIKTTDKKEPPSTEALSSATILNDKSLIIRLSKNRRR